MSDDDYRLNFDLDGTSFAVRENLVDILERELLGPAHGPEELLPISPRAQYLVGQIAPVKLDSDTADGAGEVGRSGDPTAAGADDPADEPSAVETLSEAEEIEPDDLDELDDFEDNQAEAADDDPEDRAPKQARMDPSSMGLRFQVPADLESFTVTASWGRYESVQTDETDRSDRPIRHYRRTPVEERRQVTLAELTAGQTATVPLGDSVCLRLDRYDEASDAMASGRILVEIALCNDRQAPQERTPMSMRLFQTMLRVDAGGAEAFLPVRDVLLKDWPEHDEERQRLDLQYRDRLEFAIGRTCSADWVVREGARRAAEVSTTWLPTAETPQTRARPVEGTLLSMDALASATPDELRAGLTPLVAGYGAWLDRQEAAATELPPHLQEVSEPILCEAREVHQRLADGLDHLVRDAEALRCFGFMNRVMRDQRIRSQIAALRAAEPSLTIAQAEADVTASGAEAASWYPFQLAFIVMQLAALTEPTAASRSAEHHARVELLFFPTGGGKTEAYLGLAAFAFAIRRRQGIVESSEGPLDGGGGVAVLMRYTLRLLTAQQFQRATTLVCAAELARREAEQTWGAEPFRIGLWVGTEVSPKRFEEADEQLTRANEYGGGYRLTVLQFQRCPWCGTPITATQVKADKTLRRVFVHCGDDMARCPFSKGGQVAEGLPVLTVDEEIYRLAPAFVIATVDKFARLAREGEAASLFGYVRQRCGRHGYVHPDYQACNAARHQAINDGGRELHPPATVRPVGRLRPPDLIIQDELHLITGALGTAVGLFETAVETLCSWETADGRPVRPLIVASTATVRNAQDQVRALYGRQAVIFPPQVLDAGDTWFSEEVPVDDDNPGRRYLGVSAYGERLVSAEIRIASVLLSAGQLLFNRDGDAADPYMTLVGYFSATRELAGMARYLADDVTTRVRDPHRGSGFPRRYGTSFGSLHSAELTSRIASAEIGRTLDRLGLGFDPAFDTTEASRARAAERNAGRQTPKRKDMPFDVVLATSMLQVGVDVQRLGLMLVVGQPKNTAEYIQATSRVGRDPARPGLVVTLGNWARPRDLAHFEQFRHYHETFYSQVEALSVTPYSATSLERGIAGLLVSAARVLQATEPNGLSPERAAARIEAQRSAVDALADRLRQRIAAAARDDGAARRAGDLLANRIDRWSERARQAAAMNKTLVYERTGQGDEFHPLLESPESSAADGGRSLQHPFAVANSMREVQPEINVLVSPLPERLFMRPLPGQPEWSLPAPEED